LHEFFDIPARAGSFRFNWNSIPDTGNVNRPNQSVTCIIRLTLKTNPAGPVSAFMNIQPTASDPNRAAPAVSSTSRCQVDLAALAPSTYRRSASRRRRASMPNASNLAAPNTVVVDVPPQLQLTASSASRS
jgi:hypothetical protein